MEGDVAVMNGGVMGWMWIGPALVLVGLVSLAVFGAMWARGRHSAPVEGVRQILDERFARGEIDEEEYRQRRAELP